MYNYISENNKKLSDRTDSDGLSYIAQFLDPTIKWKKKELALVWTIIKPSLDDEDDNNNNNNNIVKIIEKNLDKLQQLPLTLLFGYCNIKNIWVPHQATPEIIRQYIQLACWGSDGIDPGMAKALMCMIHRDNMNWINTWNFLSHRSENDTYVMDKTNLQQEMYTLYTNKWQQHLYTIENHHPYTDIDSILLTAMHYGIDISHAAQPFKEYMSIVLSLKDYASKSRKVVWGKIDYQPSDVELSRWMAINPKGTSLLNNYYPLFPIDIYPSDVIASLAIMEGKNTNEDTKHMTQIEFLMYSTTITTFRLGKPFIAKNDATPIRRDDIVTLSNESIVSFGSDNDGWTVTTFDEWF